MGTGNVSALARNRFAQSSHQHIDLSWTIKVLFDSPSVSPKDTQAMSLVHHEDRVGMPIPQFD